MTGLELTPRQLETLRAFVGCCLFGLGPPTVRELARQLGCSSKRADELCRRLCRLGYLDRLVRGGARAMALGPRGHAFVEGAADV